MLGVAVRVGGTAKGTTLASRLARGLSRSPRLLSTPASTDASASTPAPAKLTAPPTQPLRGHRDVLPPQSRLFTHIESTFRREISRYGFTAEIRAPILEHTDVFRATLGADSEVVQKQMYAFDDHGTPTILRPEGTAGVMRALVRRGAKSHILAQLASAAAGGATAPSSKKVGKAAAAAAAESAEGYPDRLFYCGPMFRRERPQAGRLRQFTQFGVESVGPGDASEDAQTVAAGRRALDALGLTDDVVELRINSLGDAADREQYQKDLVAYFAPYAAYLSAESRARLDAGAPLRILDCKAPRDRVMCLGVQQAQAEGIDVDPLFLAPRPADAPESLVWPPAGVPRFRLSPQSAARHAAVLAGLGALGVRFSLDPLLFRGLDYYCHTAFEFVARSGANAGSAVLSGGRYDGLSARFGGAGAGAGAEFEAVGWAAGVERLILQLEERGLCPPAPVGAHVVVVAMTAPVPNAIQYNSDLACALAPTPDTVDAAADTGAGVGVGTGAVVAAGLRLAEQLRSVTVPGSASTGAVNSGAAEGTLRVSFTPARPWRSQLAAAGAEERALVAVIIGEDELRDGLAVVKDLRARTQSKVATADVAAEVARIVAAAH